MSLYVRLNCNFYTHRKTARLKAIIGDDALWLPPRWWAYAAEHQPDGIFENYSAPELANLLGYQKNPEAMLEALLQAGFADRNPLRIHDWQDHNSYHEVFARRARLAAKARWAKERTKEKGKYKRGEEKSQALLQACNSESGQNPRKIRPPFVKGNEANSKTRTRELWQLLRDEQTLTERIKREAESCKPDPALLESLKVQRRQVREEMKAGTQQKTNNEPCKT